MKNKIMNEVGRDLDGFKDQAHSQRELAQDLQARTDNIKNLIDKYDSL
jgi:hypothetical protein